jgi:uncharacterized damage-inducible protein DinB
MNDVFYQQALYNNWANHRVADVLEKIAGSLPPSVNQLWSHLINAQVTWCNRIKSIPSPLGIWDERSLVKNNELLQTSSSELLQLSLAPVEELTKIVAYTNSAGTPFQTSLQDILQQVFFHGVYHRGQIARELRKEGFEPVNTDYITFVREGKGNQQ